MSLIEEIKNQILSNLKLAAEEAINNSTISDSAKINIKLENKKNE